MLDAESKRQLVLHRAELSAHLAASPQLRTSSPAAIGAGKTGAVSCSNVRYRAKGYGRLDGTPREETASKSSHPVVDTQSFNGTQIRVG